MELSVLDSMSVLRRSKAGLLGFCLLDRFVFLTSSLYESVWAHYMWVDQIKLLSFEFCVASGYEAYPILVFCSCIE